MMCNIFSRDVLHAPLTINYFHTKVVKKKTKRKRETKERIAPQQCENYRTLQIHSVKTENAKRQQQQQQRKKTIKCIPFTSRVNHMNYVNECLCN